MKQAYAAAREIYDELVGPRGVVGVAQRVAGDQDVQDNLRVAIAELRQAANRLQGRKEHHGGREAPAPRPASWSACSTTRSRGRRRAAG